MSVTVKRSVGEFVRVLIESDRIGVAREIREIYEKRRNDAEGVARAVIESALPVSDGDLKGLVAALVLGEGADARALVRLLMDDFGAASAVIAIPAAFAAEIIATEPAVEMCWKCI